MSLRPAAAVRGTTVHQPNLVRLTNALHIGKQHTGHVDAAKQHDTAVLANPTTAAAGMPWVRRREKTVQHKARQEGHIFFPLTQARPELYDFERDQVDPRVFCDQVRADNAALGAVEATPTGEPRTRIVKIAWKKNSQDDYDLKMIGVNAPTRSTRSWRRATSRRRTSKASTRTLW